QVLYDPSETTFENLLRIFFDRHDPTQVNGQGNDKGTQYRAGVYFHDEEQVRWGHAVRNRAWRRFLTNRMGSATLFLKKTREHR
ncbi:unnamed protein product, partial [Scytosiphon promiscuus]